MTAEYDDKPTLRGLYNTMAELSVAMRALGDSEDRISRVERGVMLAWLELHRRPALVAATRAVVQGEVTEDDSF